MMLGDDQSLKVGLVNDLVVAAIAKLIKNPVSLLWGHPKLDPSLMISLEPPELEYLEKQASKSGTKIEEYVKNAIFQKER
jgi:hypothetical protein